jgi:hypothetical protein
VNDRTTWATPLPPSLPLSKLDGLDRDECRRQLEAILGTAACIAEILSGRILDVAPLELKLAFGEQLHEVLALARDLLVRHGELGGRRNTLPRPASEQQNILAAVLAARSTSELCAGLYGHWLVELLRQCDAYLARHDPLLDAPTGRLLRRARPALEAIGAWGMDAAGDPAAVAATVARLVRLPQQPGGAPAFLRPRRARRDDRFSTFSHTRDYRAARDFEPTGDPYQDRCIELARVNRDEIDAVETFALVIHDLLYTEPVEFLADLGRLAWDEARHALIGHALLERAGYDPFALECNMVGINVRAAMDGWEALTQISVFGELGIISPMRALAGEARRRGDTVTGRAFEFITSDEVNHLRRVRSWIRRRHPAGSIAAAADAARIQAARLLAAEGICGEDYYLERTPSEISALLGE